MSTSSHLDPNIFKHFPYISFRFSWQCMFIEMLLFQHGATPKSLWKGLLICHVSQCESCCKCRIWSTVFWWLQKQFNNHTFQTIKLHNYTFLENDKKNKFTHQYHNMQKCYTTWQYHFTFRFSEGKFKYKT